MDCSPPGSSVHGILQARILEWVAMPPSRDLPDPGIEPESLMCPALAGKFFTTSTTWEAPYELSGFFFHTWPTLALSPIWECTFFWDGFQPWGLRGALASHIMGCCPPPFDLKESFCSLAPRKGNIWPLDLLLKQGLSPLCFCPDYYPKVYSGDKAWLFILFLLLFLFWSANRRLVVNI